MLNSGCREGFELKRVWTKMRLEEEQAATWLGIEMQENLSVRVESVGGSSCDGSTRGKISEERDKTWAKLIVKGLGDHPQQDRSNRPVWSWLQRDKLSSAWLQSLPGPDTSLTSAEFSEGAAAALCLPSPACMERLGQVIRGRQVVDLFGENVQSTITTGDHYRKRHDVFKMRLFQMCQWAGLEAEVEVFNLLAGSIPQEGLSSEQDGKGPQGAVHSARHEDLDTRGGKHCPEIARVENYQQLEDEVCSPPSGTRGHKSSGQKGKRVEPGVHHEGKKY